MSSRAPFALIVDDDPVESRLLEVSLKKLGIETESHNSARAFIDRLKAVEPAICFVDLNIERKGIGYTVIEAVRRARGYDPVLIVFSGDTSLEAIAHAIEVGADDFLTKPLAFKSLAEKVAHYVSTPQLADRDTKLRALPKACAARLELDFALTSIDELGVGLRGSHLLPKGLVVKISGGPLSEATGRDDGVLVTIVSTTAGADRDRGYIAHGEFDPTDEPLLTAVRGWLTRRDVSS